MEPRLSYASGFDILNPDAARSFPAINGLGGHFSIDQNVPALLRGPAGGFIASIIVRNYSSEEWDGLEAEGSQFLAGSYDFTNQLGWCFINTEGDLSAFVGDAQLGLSGDFNAHRDFLLSLAVFPNQTTPANTDAELMVNGVVVDSALSIVYGTGPNNFGIGGTVDPSYVLDAAEEGWGAITTGIAGVMVGPPPAPAAAGTLLSEIPINYGCAWHGDIMDALDLVDARPTGFETVYPNGVVPPASHLFSTRQGLPQLVDNGNETWADEVGNVVLPRIGGQQLATVRANRDNWTDPTAG